MQTGKRGRRFAGAVAAAALAATLVAPAAAFAADAPGDAKDVTATGSTQSAKITGTIKATTLKVTIPTTVAFYIDPGADASASNVADGGSIGQFASPSNFTITNYSAVDVYGFVSKVVSNDVTLVSKQADIAKPGGLAPGAANKDAVKVMVGIADTNTPLDFSKEGDWLTEAGVGDTVATRYYAFNKDGHGKLDASGNAPADAGGTCTMTMRGAVAKGGWAENDSFLVSPTFKVMVADPSTTA